LVLNTQSRAYQSEIRPLRRAFGRMAAHAGASGVRPQYRE
jgi:hypothetical protein